MLAVVAGVVAFVLVAGWSVLRWLAHGRDPSYLDDASILMAAPPEGMTAATATIIDNGPPQTAFLAGLLDLASRDEIAFRVETADGGVGRGVGVEIHGGPTDDARIRLNRRRPVAEGEAWLLAMLKGYAIEGQTGLDDVDRGLEAMQAMSGLLGFATMAAAAGAADAPLRAVDGMSGSSADPQAEILAAMERSGRPVSDHLRESLGRQHAAMELMAEASRDPAAVAADPAAFAARVEAATGRTMTADQLGEMQAWATSRQATLAAAAATAGGAAAGGPAAGGAVAALYITPERALGFHTPFGFGTFLENYARRKRWVQGLSFVSRWKWRGLAALEVLVGLLLAGIDRVGLGPIYGAGLGVAAGGLATWFTAQFMASRTREGAVMKAQLAAYRRTLKATFGAAATLDDAAGAAGMAWLETPDQALVWGVALGLRPDIEALLERTSSGIAAGTLPSDAFLPHWVGRFVRAATAATATAPAAADPPLGDYAAVFAGIERIGSQPATTSH
ncbi:MAG TPA: hypothetical protein VF323_06130 [Candidatus Limnocylindrales bacterium]